MKIRQDNDVTDGIGAIHVKMKLSYHDRSYQVQSVMKTRLDNNLIDCIGLF